MENIRNILIDNMDRSLIHMVLSHTRHKEGPDKVRIRPLLQKDQLIFQAALTRDKQEFHSNYPAAGLADQLLKWLQEDFKQLQILTTAETVTILGGKKGNFTVKRKRRSQEGQAADLSHNRKKRYLLEEGKKIPFLVDLGVMTEEGKVVKSRYDKYRQINRFLEFIEDIRPCLPADREITIVDFGCGKSYLTFAIYYYLVVQKQLDVRIIGLDLKADVIADCRRLSQKYGYEKLSFLTGDIASYEGVEQVDMVVTLHACDTATDYALAKAVRWGAAVILSVPCCQHELNGQIHNDVLAPILKYGLIRERTAALFTDALRAELLEEAGYQSQILEFIEMEHTPKNILIRAVKKGNQRKNTQLRECMDFMGVNPLLRQLLEP